jgi:hypothetical protein
MQAMIRSTLDEPQDAAFQYGHFTDVDATDDADPYVAILDAADRLPAAGCQAPLYASVEAAQGWLADHLGGRVLPIRKAWELSFVREWRDRMSALLHLDYRSPAN